MPMDRKPDSIHLTENAYRFVEDALGIRRAAIESLQPMSSGMTNRSYRFLAAGTEYILRIPGEGTGQLINRDHEAACYAVLSRETISDHVIAICPESGLKLSVFWRGTHNCNPKAPEQVKRCMQALRGFHQKGLTVPHTFDLFGEIERYEALMGGSSEYADYREVRDRCLALRPFLLAHEGKPVLSHIDSVPDNFLFVPEGEGYSVRLIDWEYAGMHDPHIDIAMFAIYSGYNRMELDQLIDWYFDDICEETTRLKIYCYVALSGLLWSNWCEYKKSLGVDYGDYAKLQYRYAATYSTLCLSRIH